MIYGDDVSAIVPIPHHDFFETYKSKWYDIDETLILKLIVFSDLNTQIMLLNNRQAELLDIVELDMVKLDMVDIS